jgi:small subunit ribosomal protein S4|uniref:Small ribosomal subunit protein uS4c n=1 Tax=Microthamnion kuetzingianum TaxID=34148 RepID=A0A097KNH3_9CHLO|nr:ribosomal protein S4 [Microthamnion kuetzingianum]AIT94726.1 ribosomal protein S4 [Microthamnion kuetzingianum]
MSRYRGPRLRIVRRLGELPGLTTKIANRQTPPGQHGSSSGQNGAPPKKLSQYAIRLQEKQKLRYNYGVTESQLIKYVLQARRMKGSTGEVLLQLLEMRLDTLVFRLGMAPTISAARQLISHGHIIVNNKKVNIPSYQCQPKEVISVVEKKHSRELIRGFLNLSKSSSIPPHISLNKENLVATIASNIQREWVNLNVEERLIVEFYSRKV